MDGKLHTTILTEFWTNPDLETMPVINLNFKMGPSLFISWKHQSNKYFIAKDKYILLMDFNMQRDKLTSSCEINLTETEPKRGLKTHSEPKTNFY